MIDIETLDKAPTAVVGSVSIVLFNLYVPQEEVDLAAQASTFNLDITEQHAMGRTISADTVQWWLEQPEEAQRAAFKVTDDKKNFEKLVVLHTILGSGKIKRIWGNGANFDNVILYSLFETYKYSTKGFYKRDCCYRTIKNIFTENHLVFPDHYLKHSSLDDALYQVQNLQHLMSKHVVPLEI